MPYYTDKKLSDAFVKKMTSDRIGEDGKKYNKGSALVFCPDAPVKYPDRPFCYVAKSGEACPVPAVPPEEPGGQPAPGSNIVVKLNEQGEGFITDGKASIGVNRLGGLGTMGAAPAGIPTNAPAFTRVGLFNGAIELLLNGFFASGHVGPDHNNVTPGNPKNMSGAVAIEGDALAWRGGGVDLRYAFDGRTVTISGHSDKPLAYAIDPDEPKGPKTGNDQSKASITTNVLAAGMVSATTASGHKVTLRSERVTLVPMSAVKTIGPDVPVLAPVTRKGDDLLVALFEAGAVDMRIEVGS